jgi:hypothetical protein
MFKAQDAAAAEAAAKKVIDYLGDHNQFKSHGARIGVAELRAQGVPVKILNEDNSLHDAVMTVYHSLLLTFGGTGAYRIIENSRGDAYIRVVQLVAVGPGPVTPVPKPGGGKK